VAIGRPTAAQVRIDALNNRITAIVFSQVLRFGDRYKVNAGRDGLQRPFGDDLICQSSGGNTIFPPLWGSRSFNWGAGMGEIQNAAGFIKANMPLALGGTLTNQQAWDVATFMDSQDPRFAGSVDATREKFHDTPYSMYGRQSNGRILGTP
jgi:hypothetical protein